MNVDCSFIVEDMTFSFSRINSFKQCPYAWYKQYILCEERESGFYSEYGSYMHKILEKFFKNELEIYELVTYYEDNYDENVISPPPYFPSGLGEKYYTNGIEYLEEFTFDFDRYKVLGVEKKLEFKIGKYNFIGFVDLLLKDLVNDKIIIVDYKSSDPYKKNKTPNKKKIQEYSLQQYLYAYAIEKEFKQYPSEFQLWFFRLNKNHTIPFKIDDMNNTLLWATNEIDKIIIEKEWKPLSDYYFCTNLCSMRCGCEYKIYNQGQ